MTEFAGPASRPRNGRSVAYALAAAVGLGLGLGLLGSSARSERRAPSARHAITITGFRFIPESVAVSAGDTVIWSNADPFLHIVRQDSGGAVRSPDLRQGERFVWVARQRGRLPYHCEAHAVMRGVLTVQ